MGRLRHSPADVRRLGQSPPWRSARVGFTQLTRELNRLYVSARGRRCAPNADLIDSSRSHLGHLSGLIGPGDALMACQLIILASALETAEGMVIQTSQLPYNIGPWLRVCQSPPALACREGRHSQRGDEVGFVVWREEWTWYNSIAQPDIVSSCIPIFAFEEASRTV
jgi:hypothetical protein